eukprot:COSAG01_NODE_188_length_22632_cov_15.284915_7_plen_496_part_00
MTASEPKYFYWLALQGLPYGALTMDATGRGVGAQQAGADPLLEASLGVPDSRSAGVRQRVHQITAPLAPPPECAGGWVTELDSADAYDQPALLYRMSSAGMAKDPIHGHSTYYHETIILHRLFQLYILRLNIVGTFLSTCSFSTRPRTYKLLQASPYKLLDSKRTHDRMALTSDSWMWSLSSPPSCALLADQRAHGALISTVTLHRAFELQQFGAGHARGPVPPTPPPSQSTQDTGAAPSPDSSVLDATMQVVNTFSSSMTSFLSKSRGSIKHSRSDVLKDASSLLSGSRYGIFTGEDTFPAEAWVADVRTFTADDTFLAEFKEHERPRNLWEVILRCVGTTKPSGRNFSPKSYLEYQRAELIKSGTPAAQYPTFDMIAQWLLDEFPSDNAKATLLAEFLNERPTRMEPEHLIEKLLRRIQPIRDLEAVSVQQRPFEQLSSHVVYNTFMECLESKSGHSISRTNRRHTSCSSKARAAPSRGGQAPSGRWNSRSNR